ncbi:MAG: TraM recognition domain-containing protein [Coxiellaceae bacterium]|nr:TraM recognition domain-containing protein [Coxiellaceae bacterium]
MAFQRGLDENQEAAQRFMVRDTRPLSTRVYDFFKNPHGVAIMLCAGAAAAIIVGYLSDIIFIFGVGVFFFCYFQKSKLPFRMPQRSHQKDYNDPLPGGSKPRMARGIYFFGNDKKTSQELWFGNEDMRTHALIFGSTGSGKTEALVSIAFNALCQASGFIYVDGKGDNSLFSKVFSMVRSMGREDDILLINFMTGAKDIMGAQERRLSNTINPFAQGSSSMLSQLVVSLMDSGGSSSDGDMWKGRAISFVESLMKVLVAMRDAGHILLDANTIRNYFHLPRLETMVLDKLFVRDGKESVNIEGLPPSILEPINNYLFNLPGYNKEKKHKQVSQVLEQHGFITMQLTRVFTSLADTYGHIMRTELAEVDLKDVVLNRRILVVLLPALEKSPDELANLGKVIISSLKAMMAAGLGEAVEGDYAELVTSKPTNSATPYLCILDEYGYYAVQGFAVVPAQARSLGFSVIFAGQDLPAFQKASKEEAASIGANTNIKICMKLEDPTETWDFFMKGAGESYVTHVDSFQVDQGSVLGNYQDSKGAKLEKRARIDLLDLKEQREGEGHFFFKSKIVRGSFFYANPPPVKRLHLNHFLKVAVPEDQDIERINESFKHFSSLVESGISIEAPQAGSEEIDQVCQLMASGSDISMIDTSAVAIHRFHGDTQTFASSFFDEPTETLEEHLAIFMPMRRNEHVTNLLPGEDLGEFGRSLLDRADTRDYVEYCQRLCGKSGQQAMNVALEIVGDMQKGTDYPPDIKPLASASEIANDIHNLVDAIVLKKQEAMSQD